MGSVEAIVGREAELATVRAMLDRLPEGGGAMLVHGDPGIGKSTLLSAAHREADDRGFRTLRTAGSQVEADMSFAGLHRVLHPVLDQVDELPRRQQDALLVAFGHADGPAPERFVLALAALELLACAAARRPLMILVEDVHWLDRASADALAFVARRLESEPIVLVAASRQGPDAWPVDPGVHAMRLEPLDDQEAQTLLAQKPMTRRSQRRRILDLAAGNPLALVELPRALADNGQTRDTADPAGLPLTERLSRAFAARATGLPDATRSILLVTALEEGLWIADVLRAARMLDPDGIDESDVEPAIDAGLLRGSDGRLRFGHPLMRSAISAQASPATRRAAHAALGAILVGEPERAVWHRAYACVGPDEVIARELAGAAALAVRRGALAEGARRLDRASELSADRATRIPWILDAAELAAQINDRELADDLLGRLSALELDVRGRARRDGVQETFARISDTDEPRIRHLVASADACVEADERAMALDLLLAAALRCFWAQPTHDAREAVVRAARATGVPPGTPKLVAVLGVADPLGCGASVSEQLGRLGTAPIGAAEDARLLGLAAYAIGDFAAALRLMREAADGLRAEGRLGLLALTQIVSAWSAIVRGELDAGLLAAEEGRRLALESAQLSWAAAAHNGIAVVLGIRGDADGAARMVREGAQRMEELPLLLVGGMAFALGVAALGAGRSAEAYDQLAQLMVPPDPDYPLREYQGILGYLVEAAIAAGRIEEVRSRAEDFGLSLAADPAHAHRPGEALAVAVLADDDAQFAAALGTVGSPFERARVQLARGGRLRQERHFVAAREPLREARDTFDRLGVAPWAEVAREQLRAAGEISETRKDRAWDALSAQEKEIARLAASGMSNKDIGRRLYLSHRTVGSHLYRLFPKLGIISRAQLGPLIPNDDEVPGAA